jgi:hypothetical protein
MEYFSPPLASDRWEYWRLIPMPFGGERRTTSSERAGNLYYFLIRNIFGATVLTQPSRRSSLYYCC